MAFENLVLGLDFLEEPGFTTRVLRDVNPLNKSKKKRLIEIPNDVMKIIHGRFVGYLRHLPIKYHYATGCLPGSSPLGNVQRHRHNRFFYLVDLKQAYSHVKVQELARAICQADPSLNGQRREVRGFLTKYCMSRFGGLATGAPASPDLFNLYCFYLLDKPLEKIIIKHGLTYTRYLDDLTFSSKERISRSVRKEIREIIKLADFPANHLKSEVRDLKKGSIVINGIGLEFGGRVFLPRDFTCYLFGLLHKGQQGHIDLWPKIEGAMRVYFSDTSRKKLNQTERRVIKEYKKFRRFLDK